MITILPTQLGHDKISESGVPIDRGTTIYRLKDMESDKLYRLEFLYRESANLVASIFNAHYSPQFSCPGFGTEANALTDILPHQIKRDYYA